jgi:hypothetical protein
MRVTNAMLDIVVKRLNESTGMPLTPYVGREPQAGLPSSLTQPMAGRLTRL